MATKEKPLNRDYYEYLENLLGQIYSRKKTPDEAVAEIRQYFGGASIYFPQAGRVSRRIRIIKAIQSGATTSEITQRYGVSRMTVWAIRKDLKAGKDF